ncbi:MAG: acetyltransferase [Candidatus Acidiferrales bacterium]
MRTRRVFVYGAGGHGKVVADILISKGDAEFAGFVDDREELRGTKVLGLPVFGDSEWLRRETAKSRIAIALGVGENRCRQLLADRCSRWQIDILTLVHPAATVSRAAELGRGTVVMAGAVINPDAKVGAGAIVNTGAVVEHDVEVGDYAHLAPNAAMGGASQLGAFCHLGLGAVVLECIRIGPHTIVGAGAVVVKNLPGHVVAIGVPAQIHRQLCQAGELVKQAVTGNVGP